METFGIILAIIVGAAFLAAGLTVLITWLLRRPTWTIGVIRGRGRTFPGFHRVLDKSFDWVREKHPEQLPFFRSIRVAVVPSDKIPKFRGAVPRATTQKELVGFRTPLTVFVPDDANKATDLLAWEFGWHILPAIDGR